MPRKEIVPVPLPPSTVPLSRAIRFGNLLFVSGTVGGDVVADEWGDIREQVRYALDAIRVSLESAGTALEHVLSVTAYLKNAKDFAAYNEVYRTFFPSDFPTRTTIQADLMLPSILVEISCIAGIPEATP